MKKSLLLLSFLVIALGISADEPIQYINGHKIDNTTIKTKAVTTEQDFVPSMSEVQLPDSVLQTDSVPPQELEVVEVEESSKDISHWSLTLEAGLNLFDGDIIQDYNSLTPSSLAKTTFGASLQYTMQPAWGVGVDYYYLPLSAHDERDNGYVVADFNSKMHNVSVFCSINLIRLFNRNSKSKWGIWANLGLGYAWYKSTYFTDRAGLLIPNGHHVKYKDFNDTISDGRAAFVPLGLLFEYNFTKNLALGLKTQIRAYNKDYLEQRIQKGVTNDFVELATLQLRWKFDAQRKNHTRNFVEESYAGQIDELQRKVDAIVIPEIPDYGDRIDDLDGRVRKMEDILCPDGPDGDNDGVPDCRDLEPETPEGIQVDFWGRTIPKSSATGVYTIDEEAVIYFDFDKTNLDNEAHRAIAICARKMKADSELIVEVRGFTDNMGSIAYNADLSQRRADKVKKVLIETYEIDGNRIIANGKGKYNPKDKTIPFRPYRTCILFYNK